MQKHKAILQGKCPSCRKGDLFIFPAYNFLKFQKWKGGDHEISTFLSYCCRSRCYPQYGSTLSGSASSGNSEYRPDTCGCSAAKSCCSCGKICSASKICSAAEIYCACTTVGSSTGGCCTGEICPASARQSTGTACICPY